MSQSPAEIDELAATLRQAHAQYRSLVESMDLGYILVDVIVDDDDAALDLRYVEANARAIKMTGAELAGRTTRELAPGFEQHWFDTFGRVARTGVTERHEFPASPLGVWYDFCVFKVGAPESRRVVALYQDVTDRKRAEATLREREEQLRGAHDELEGRVRERTLELARVNDALKNQLAQRQAAEAQIKALLKQMVTIQEEERRRVARDIHDQLGQQITALRLNLQALELPGVLSETLAEPIGRVRQLADELDQTVDLLAWTLRPVTLDHLGLSDALANLTAGWSERFGINATYHGGSDDAPAPLAPDIETNLYRITQEALHNIYKHANASHARVTFEHSDSIATLVVEDDGRGFDANPHEPVAMTRLGLVNMRERAALAGGQLVIASREGHGTVVSVSIVLATGDQRC